MSSSLLVSLAAIFLTLLGLIFTYFGWIVSIKEALAGLVSTVANSDFKDISKRLGQVEIALAKVETAIGGHNISDMAAKLDLFWVAMEPALKEVIKQPIHFRKDDLLDRFPNLEDKELCELREILQDEMVDLKAKKDPKVLAYALMTARLDSVLYDRRRGCDGKV